MNLHKACWISAEDKKKMDEFVDSKYRHIARDKDGKRVFMAESKAWLQMVQDNFPDIDYHFTSEF
jgi:peptide chain release factor 3